MNQICVTKKREKENIKISSLITSYAVKKVPCVSVLFSAQDHADNPWDMEHWRSPVCKGMGGKVSLKQ